jgi:hypothetical protein
METTVKLSLPSLPDADLSLPNDDDTEQQRVFTEQVMAFDGSYESRHGTNPQLTQQHQVLQAFVAVFKEWAGPHNPFHVFVSGSYRLGVHDNGADIDILFVTTSGITRADVFNSFAKLLETHKDVSNFQPVPRAKVPVIGLTFQGQEFDVLTCHLKCAELPAKSSLLTSYEWMNCMQEECILAFNGPRVTEMILSSVRRPNQFCAALKYIREWAKRRCVYSNKSGYLGGVNLALMLVFVSQRRPNALAFRLVKDFFSTFAKWRWSAHNPLKLDAHIEQECPVWLQSLEWTPRSSESMVVLTACFPRFNTTYSASKYSTGILQKELERANACVDAGRWLDACNGLDVFVSCQRFIRVRLQSPNTSSGKTWIGYMQAQTRHLIQLIANEELAIAELRYIARWCETDKTSTDSFIHAETFVTADDDGKPRSYLVRGNLERPVTYFDATFGDAGPARPEGAAVKIGFCTNASIPEELREYSARASAEVEADVKELVEKNRRLTAAPSALAIEQPQGTCSAKELRTQIKERTVNLHKLSSRAIVGQRGIMRKHRVLSLLPACPLKTTKFVRPVVAKGQLLTPFDVFIGKSGCLGEHYFACAPGLALPADYDGDMKAYEDRLLDSARKYVHLRNIILVTAGKTLGCWCVPAGKPECHGHALLRVAKRLEST